MRGICRRQGTMACRGGFQTRPCPHPTLAAFSLGVTAGTVVLAVLFHRLTRRYSLQV